MLVNFANLSPANRYHLMTQTIIPRPIAWVLTKNNNETYNLAPFSYFNAICSAPPLLLISVGQKPTGGDKDTTQNLSMGKFCVVHIPSAPHAQMVTATAATLPYGESELTESSIELINQEYFDLPRIKQCSVAYMCRVYDIKRIGDAPQSLIFLEILHLFADDSVVVTDDKGRATVDAQCVDPLARLGANQYAAISEPFDIQRPK